MFRTLANQQTRQEKRSKNQHEEFENQLAIDARDQSIAALREALANAEERIRRQTRQLTETDQLSQRL